MAIQVASLFATIGVDTNPLTKGLKSAIGSFASFAGAIAVAKKAIDFSREGAQLRRLDDTSKSLARSMGMSMDSIVDAVRSASLGMVADADIMQSASRAMMLGVGESAEQLAQLMEVAAMRGRAMGLTTTQAFNDIVTGIGRMSPMILDNLGIVTGGKKTFEEYAASIGKAADALTDAEKKQALIGKAIESTAPLMEQEGGMTRDIAGNWEYAAAQVKNYIDNKKKALALERGEAGDWNTYNGLPTGRDGAIGYVEAVGLAFERARIDTYNKTLLELADNLGIISGWQKDLSVAPIIGTQDIRAEWVTKLLPALNEYDRLVNEAGMSSDKAGERVKYLFDTFGMSAFTGEMTQSWADMNDRIYETSDAANASADALDGLSEEALAAAKAQADMKAEFEDITSLSASYGDIISLAKNYTSLLEEKESLAIERKKLINQGWSEESQRVKDLDADIAAVGDEMDKLANKMTLDMFAASIAIGGVTDGEMQAYFDMAVNMGVISREAANMAYQAWLDAKAEVEGNPINAQFTADNTEAMETIDELKAALRGIERNIGITVSVNQMGQISNRPITEGTRASGGNVDAGTPYIVGERGMELFMPNTNGQIISNDKLLELLGGNGKTGNTYNLVMPTTANPMDIKMAFELMEAWNG